MAVYRAVQTAFWQDEKVIDEFTPEDRYFMLYIMTNPHTNQIGCYNITTRQIEFETGYNLNSVTKLLERFENIHKVIKYSFDTKELLICNWHKYNWSKSPKVKACILKEHKNIKNKVFIEYLDTLFIDYGYSIDTISQEKEKEKEKEKENIDTPSIEDIKNYCNQVAKRINIDDFYNYYSASDWLDKNGLPINWKQKVLSWSKKCDYKEVTEVRYEPYNPYK